MKNEKYYVGFDIGTDSVGYAVTSEGYELRKFKGEPMWGVTLFEPAQLAVERRGYRTSRRRLDRRQQRAALIMELFAKEIAKVDEDFYRRIKESYLYSETEDQKIRLFASYAEQKAYMDKYPTIHHLIAELMNSKDVHDVRLVYIACAWLAVHRGHFLSEVDKNNIDSVTQFKSVWDEFVSYLTRSDAPMPWRNDVDINALEDVFKAGMTVAKKSKALAEVLFDGKKAPKEINDTYEYNYETVLKLLCGGKDMLSKLFGKEEYKELEERSLALNMEDEKIAAIMQSVDDSDAELISAMKAVYDWSVLVNVLKGKKTISEAKVSVYEQHKKDLAYLKKFIKKYAPQRYNDVFRSDKNTSNYVAYIGNNKTSNEDKNVKKTAKREDFCKYVLSVIRSVQPDDTDLEEYHETISRLEINEFMPKQVDGDNRVIPYQLYWYELNKILENASSYIGFLNETDVDGISGAEKILSVLEFKVPYYVGPLRENKTKDRRLNHWMVRKAEGKIYPWNYKDKIDLDKCEDAFIDRMTNSCSYLPSEDVLPKNSLIYSAFEVLNEINNIKVNGNEIPVSVKQKMFEDVFMQYDKVSFKRIKQFMISNGYSDEDVITGIDIAVNSSLKPFRAFRNLVSNGILTYGDAENIIRRATYSEDKTRFKGWLIKEYPHLPESEIRYICGLKFKEFGRLSRKLLCGIEGAVNKDTGEYMTIIRTMWETNLNFMQIISCEDFGFAGEIKSIVDEYYANGQRSLSERLDEMYVSNAVKRPIIRTLDILKDIVKTQKTAPEMIFIEMARGASEDQKGRTKTRLDQLKELYEKVDTEDVRVLTEKLEEWGDTAHNKLQSDKIFLYFIQLGKCLYTGDAINLDSVLAGNGEYNIEHIYPRSFVKDDSVINNEILVDSKANGDKSDNYPIDPAIRNKMHGYWTYLNKLGFISDEKYKRLVRNTPFTDDERYEFINRQLVETRQSTKAVATLLGELYPNTEIVYVKAGLVSDFRQRFGLLKSRAVNDLHHAKDAYLNIVVGNVWHHKFSKRFYIKKADNNVKPEIVFTRKQICGNKTVWNGEDDIGLVKRTMLKNTPHVTKYAFRRKGGFFDQMPVPAGADLVERKKGMPTEIYGGYNKTTASFFVLVRYEIGTKRDVMVMPVELLYANEFLSDPVYADEYAKKTVGSILKKEITSVEILLNRRILKVNTMLSLDGFKVCITGKSGGGKQLGISVMENFKTSLENELYIKKLESFINKKKKNEKIVYNERYDEISSEKNVALYEHYVDKLQASVYKKRPANPLDALLKGKERFEKLSPPEQAEVLLQIQGLFGRAIKADLSAIGGAPSSGVAMLSSNVSNWKKNYKDVRIIDRSSSGLYEKASDVNLLDLV